MKSGKQGRYFEDLGKPPLLFEIDGNAQVAPVWLPVGVERPSIRVDRNVRLWSCGRHGRDDVCNTPALASTRACPGTACLMNTHGGIEYHGPSGHLETVKPMTRNALVRACPWSRCQLCAVDRPGRKSLLLTNLMTKEPAVTGFGAWNAKRLRARPLIRTTSILCRWGVTTLRRSWPTASSTTSPRSEGYVRCSGRRPEFKLLAHNVIEGDSVCSPLRLRHWAMASCCYAATSGCIASVRNNKHH